MFAKNVLFWWVVKKEKRKGREENVVISSWSFEIAKGIQYHC